MGNVADFELATRMFREEIEDSRGTGYYADRYREQRERIEEAYMSDMQNWCLVHATEYMPSRNADGKMFIATTAMATNYASPRTTVHTALNHVVNGHGGGSWAGAPYVIFFSYKDTVALNGNPLQVSMFDTYFCADSDRGLVLPEGAYLVRPSNDCLYSIGEHEATYKTCDFTNEEIKQILSLAPFSDYDESLPLERRNRILTEILRNTVVRLAMKKKGYKYVDSYDGGKTATAVMRTARDSGLTADASNKGHSSSFIERIEKTMIRLMSYVNAWIACGNNTDDVYEELVYRETHGDFQTYVLQCIVKSEPVDMYDWFVEIFKQYDTEEYWDYKSVQYSWPALNKMMHRCSDAMAERFMGWLYNLKKSADYEKFHHRLDEHLMEDARNQHGVVLDLIFSQIEYHTDVEYICNGIMEYLPRDKIVVTHLVNCILKSEPLNWYDFYMKQFVGDVKCPDGKTFAEYYKYMHSGLEDDAKQHEMAFTKFLSDCKTNGIYDELCVRLRGQMQSMQYSVNPYSNMERR